MKLDDLQQEHITYLLIQWHTFMHAQDRVSSGAPRTSPGFQDHRHIGRWDIDGDDFAEEATNAEIAATDEVISKMAVPWVYAIHTEARNLNSNAYKLHGIKAIRNPRIPLEDHERVTQEARKMLWDGMAKKKLV